MKPVILDFCTERKGDPKKSFYYDSHLNLNVVKVGAREVPFVDVENIELMIKTEVKRERDDHYINTLELLTKTLTTRERDD